MNVLLLFLLIDFVESASYSNYQYDFTAPIFTPDGRLLQVEYASAAADRSSPIVVARINDDLTVVVTTRAVSKVQPRLIVLEDCNCVVGMSGVIADSLALLDKIGQASVDHRRQFGRPLDADQVAATAATACQRHAFGGGLRPYGSTLVVAGRRPSGIVSTVTDPSGAIRQLDASVAVLGSGALQRKIDNEWYGSDRLTRLVKLVYSEARKGDDDDVVVEVVAVSTKLGVYKVSAEQLDRLLPRKR